MVFVWKPMEQKRKIPIRKENEYEKEIKCKNDKEVDIKIFSEVKELNCKAIKMLDKLIEFKNKVLEEVLCCKLFSSNPFLFNSSFNIL